MFGDIAILDSAILDSIKILKRFCLVGLYLTLLYRALCRIKLLPVTHVLVDTWMLTVKPVYKLLNVPDDPKWTTNTHVTPFSLIFKA